MSCIFNGIQKSHYETYKNLTYKCKNSSIFLQIRSNYKLVDDVNFFEYKRPAYIQRNTDYLGNFFLNCVYFRKRCLFFIFQTPFFFDYSDMSLTWTLNFAFFDYSDMSH
ncbi:hypothetical protein BpHYR1_050605 [Brachionus plicatilis]|uniref:Uncharacterized protein n=1 Tax=Brachionus plicatilis TaxID=10195 RepID=A0A3M7QMW4_BRAPC|nr:hypothetical protein BpHYR1_050605 [Brachionus plicatilis]